MVGIGLGVVGKVGFPALQRAQRITGRAFAQGDFGGLLVKLGVRRLPGCRHEVGVGLPCGTPLQIKVAQQRMINSRRFFQCFLQVVLTVLLFACCCGQRFGRADIARGVHACRFGLRRVHGCQYEGSSKGNRKRLAGDLG